MVDQTARDADSGTGLVTEKFANVTVQNRRMLRESNERESARKRKQR